MTEYGLAAWCRACQCLVLNPHEHVVEEHLSKPHFTDEPIVVDFELTELEMEPRRR